MTEEWKIPSLDNRFVCVSSTEAPNLCAEVSSCFAKPDLYFPVLLFPELENPMTEEYSSESDDFVGQMIGHETAVLINNCFAKMRGYGHILYVGLSDAQKSYLNQFFESPIEIKSSADIDEKLRDLIDIPKDLLPCRSEDILAGLFKAVSTNKRLVIDEAAPEMTNQLNDKEGFILIEKHDRHPIFSIIGVNYAIALDADIHIASALSEQDEENIQERLERWHDEGNHNHLRKVISQITRRIEGVDLSGYRYATFFTSGIPYSLGIENQIPCTHVHLSLRPDLFVCNSIGMETGGRFHSAVVFSPQFFTDEETEMVIDTLTKENYYIRPLIGKRASAHNLDFHAQHFPYDLLHICSHGGGVDGQEVTESFKDRDGVSHTLIYDEVVSFAPVPGKDLIGVTRKVIFRKFDGYKWKSKALNDQNIPHYVFMDLRKAIFKGDGPSKNAKRSAKKKIPTSCAIQCSDDFHQGMFQILSSHNSPVIYNNSCLSWGQVAHFFLSAGARGYIGTLWNIGNTAAVTAANIFYSSLGTYSVMSSLHRALKGIEQSPSKDIYLYWGLHFTSVGRGVSDPEEGRKRVFHELMRAFFVWTEKIPTMKSEEVKKNSTRIAEELHQELATNFNKEDLDKMFKEFEEKVIKKKTEDRSTKREESTEDIRNQDSLDLERYYRPRR